MVDHRPIQEDRLALVILRPIKLNRQQEWAFSHRGGGAAAPARSAHKADECGAEMGRGPKQRLFARLHVLPRRVRRVWSPMHSRERALLGTGALLGAALVGL